MRPRSLNILVCVLWLAACGTEEGGRQDPVGSTAGGSPSTAGGNDASTDPTGGANGGQTGTSAGDGGGLTGGTSNGTNGDGGKPPAGSAVRFVVLGDGGTGEAAQKKVAAAMKTVCAMRGCSFALYLGDNIYESGVSGVGDSQFQTKFEDPYSELDFPFYVVLGNHDYGNNGTNLLLLNDDRSDVQVEYTGSSDKWNMPDYYYTFREGPVAFFGLDTNSIVIDQFRKLDEQQAWLDTEISKSDAPWKIVFGHHPYISNGDHGNAGSYAGAGGAEFPKGGPFKTLVEESVCGKAQVYFSGHDHDREWLEPTCGTTFIVSGAAAKLRELPGRGSPTLFGDDTKHGFMWVEIAGDVMTGVFYDEDAKVSYEDTVMRK